MKIILGEEKVIVQGMTLEENPWGKYQFPTPGYLDGRLIVSVFVGNDTLVKDEKPGLWFTTDDKGETWREIPNEGKSLRSVILPCGDRISFPNTPGIDMSDYEFTSTLMLTPDYDFKKQATGKKMPLHDGVVAWFTGDTIWAFNADRLPAPLNEKKWKVERIKAGETEKVTEYAEVDWPYLTRVVLQYGNSRVMKSIYPVGKPKIAPDGSIWIGTFSGEAHLNPKNGQFSPYYSAEIFRSTDNGKSFKLHSHMEYPADGEEYPYSSGGFSDNDFEFMDDGSIIWFFRSAWYGSTSKEWAPMYFARSIDGGITWTKPREFAAMGIMPSLCKLKCGVTLLAYGRPGMFIRACKNDNPIEWCEPITVIPAEDRSHLANVVSNEPTWRVWDGQCGNEQLVPISDNEALILYGDFYYPDENGIKRKTILSRKITVVE